MRSRALHASTRRAFLLAPLLVAGSVWPAAGAGSVPTYPVPVVITDGVCNPAAMVLGETCAVWHADDGLGASDLGYANLFLWDVPADALCTNAGSTSRTDWIASGYPDPRVLAGDPPGSEPTYVCGDTGSSARDLSDLQAQVGAVRAFPINDCAGQVDAAGDPDPCPATPHKYDIVKFARMRILGAYAGDDPAAIGTPGPPPTAGACGIRTADPAAICLVLEFRGPESVPDVQVAHSHGGPYAGDGVYDEDGDGQVIEEGVRIGSRTFVVFMIENDGDADGTFTVTGPGDRGGMIVRYATGGEEVTGEVTGAGLTIDVPTGANRLLQLRIRVPADAERGTVRRWTVRASPPGEPGRVDAARVRVPVLRCC